MERMEQGDDGSVVNVEDCRDIWDACGFENVWKTMSKLNFGGSLYSILKLLFWWQVYSIFRQTHLDSTCKLIGSELLTDKSGDNNENETDKVIGYLNLPPMIKTEPET